MAEEFVLVLLLAAFGTAAALPMLVVPALFAPRRPTSIKLSTFEAGQPPAGESRVHLMMQYYAYLLMFTIFDVMLMFLFAWGISFRSLAASSGLTIILFLGTILIPMAYALVLAGRRELW